VKKPSIHRRDFLKSTAATASTLALANASPVHATSGDILKVGLVGCGGRGTGAAEQALQADPNVKLWAVGDAFRNRLDSSMATLRRREALRDKIDAPVDRQFVGFNAYQDVINSGVDVVLLATPPHFRPMHLKAAVNANKHVFVEKPVAVDGPGCRTILASCEEARRRNLSIVSGLCYRYDPPKREIMRRIHDGAIGQIVALHTTYNTGATGQRQERQEGWSDMEWQMRNWYYFTWLSGDHNVEQHVHSLDKMAWAMGDQYPVRAVGIGGRQVRTDIGNIFDHHCVVYEFANGVRCHSYCRQMPGCANEVSDFVTGTTGIAVLNGTNREQHRIFNLQRTETWRYAGPTPSMYQVEHNELFASIRNGKPINNGEYMTKSTLMGIMGRMATYTGKQITWQQAQNSQEDLSPPRYDWGPLPVPPVARPGVTQVK
jgi:myo-inositol 2-dehydrogenase / D-chiro-inositol 1-dehydrogenase